MTANAGRTPTGYEFLYATVLGEVPGWSMRTAWNENEDVQTSQEEMSNIAGIRTLPSSAAVISVVSTTANDTSAGSGVQTLRVNYLDANWDLQTEVLTLNGTTPVTTAGTAIRLMSALAVTVGSGENADGTITFSIGGNDQASFKVGQNETRESSHHVPAGYRGILDKVIITTGRGGTTDLDFAFEIRDGDAESPWITIRSSDLYEFSIIVPGPNILLPEKFDMRVLVKGSATGISAFVSTDIIRIKDRL